MLADVTARKRVMMYSVVDVSVFEVCFEECSGCIYIYNSNNNNINNNNNNSSSIVTMMYAVM